MTKENWRETTEKPSSSLGKGKGDTALSSFPVLRSAPFSRQIVFFFQFHSDFCLCPNCRAGTQAIFSRSVKWNPTKKLSDSWTQCKWQSTYPIDQLYRGEIQSWYYCGAVRLVRITLLRNMRFWAVAWSQNGWILAKFFRDGDEVEVNENWCKTQIIQLS